MNPGDPVTQRLRHAAMAALMLLSICNAALAQLASFDYQRTIKTHSPGWYFIPLSPEIQAQSKSSLNDFRIYKVTAEDTIEIQYLMENLGDRKQVQDIPFVLINDTYNEKCCSYITLKFPRKQVINEIMLNIAESNFDKWVKVEGSMDNKEWFTIRERVRIAGFNNGEADFLYTRLRFPPAEYTYFRVVVDDESSKRVNITGAQAAIVQTEPGRYEELKIKNIEIKNLKKEKITEVYVELADPYFVDHVTLTPATTEDFYRNINVYYLTGITKTEAGAIEHWSLVNAGLFTSLGDEPGDNTHSTTLPSHGYQTWKLKLEIINKDNQPVEIGSIKAFGEARQLVSKLPQGDLRLAYGKANAYAPEYDLVHFTQNIPHDLTGASLGKETSTGSPVSTKALIEDKIWLWVAMGGILLLILIFSVNMLRKS